MADTGIRFIYSIKWFDFGFGFNLCCCADGGSLTLIFGPVTARWQLHD